VPRSLFIATALLILALALVPMIDGHIPGLLDSLRAPLSGLLARHGVGAAVALLYLEESGIPVLMPGDVFVMYIGHRAATEALQWLGFWLMVIAAVVMGATNLYVVSRRLGRHLAEGRLGVAVYLTPGRLQRAEQWFQRWGIWALILGRHIPGARIPITIAAGVLRVPYRMFAVSVAVSTAVWAALFLVVGGVVGDGVAVFLAAHRSTYVVLPALGLLLAAYLGIRLWSLRRPPQRTLEPVPKSNRCAEEGVVSRRVNEGPR